MKPWPEGEIRRVERGYSPNFGCDGYYMLGAFNKTENLPSVLQEILNANHEEVLLIQCTGKKHSPQSDHDYYTFKLVGKYSYEALPDHYKDNRGQYPPDLETRSWEGDNFNVNGFPLRPWVKYPHPCTSDEFYSLKEKEKNRVRSNRYQ